MALAGSLRQLARVLVLALMTAACGGGGGAGGRVEIVVSAAASLSDVMGEAATLYEARHPEIRVLTNYGGSGALEQQIRQGAQVDVFVSAGVRQMDALEGSGLVRAGTRTVVARNELVLAVPAGREGVGSFADLAAAGAGRVAMGAPESVPAGEYARETLVAQGLWDEVRAKLIYTTDVRQALAYVARGEVDAALVYRTDAMGARGVRVAAVAPEGTHEPIVYPAAVPTTAPTPAEAERYLAFLATPDARAIFRRFGFAPPPGAPAD
jgi:molybdate transport system substrate-binding protein